MSLATSINAYYKEPSATVRFNSNRVRDVVSIALSSSLEGSLSTASIRTLNNPNITPESRVVISQGYSSDERTTFTGYVDSIEYSELEQAYVINCRDVLKKAMDTFLVQEVKFGFDPNTGTYYYSTYTSNDGGTFTVHEYSSLGALNSNHPETSGNYSSEGVYAHAVVQWLLHMSGLAEGSEIQVDNTNFWIGDLGPAKFHLTSVYDACNQIANLIGWRLYADPVGVARFKKKPRQPGGYSSWSYTDVGEPHNIQRITKTTSNLDLRNYVEVRGASGIRYVARSASPYIGNTPYRGVLISDELIDTQGIATFVGNRVLTDLNRLKVSVSMEADGNPILVPGSTLNITAERISGKFLVEQIQTNESADGGYKMTISAAQYLGDTGWEEDTSAVVVASFVPQFVSILGDPKVIVQFEGAGSYSNRGIIANYFWQWPNGSTTNGPSSQAWYIFNQADISNGNSQTVTLTVTDALGNIGTTSSGITMESLLDNNVVKYRALYGALNTVAVGSVDGGQNWITNAIPAISVAASNFGPGGVYVASGHALFGTSDGKIYKTVDTCATMVNTGSPGGEVTDIHIPELDSSKAYAVNTQGEVYYSGNSGDTWSLIGSFAFPLREVKAAYTDYKYVVVVGSGVDNIYQTFDLGANWSRVSTGKDVLWATDGASTNYYLNTQGVITGAGTDIPFTGGGHPSMVAGTVKVFDDTGLMGVDDTGQHWNLASGIMLQTQYNPTNKTKHMIRDGEMPVVYYAVASGISKSLDYNESIMELYYPTGSMPTNGWGMKVAYGPLASPTVSGIILYRGYLSHPDGTHPQGFWASTNGTMAYAFTDPGGILCYAPGVVALVADHAIHRIDITASGGTLGIISNVSPQYVSLPLIKHENWYEPATSSYRATTGDWTANGAAFWNRHGVDPVLCWFSSADTTILNNYNWARKITDFDNPSGTIIGKELDGPFTNRGATAQYTVDSAGQMIAWQKKSVIDPGYYFLVTFEDELGKSGLVSDPEEPLVYNVAPYVKFRGDWRSFGSVDDAGREKIVLIQGYENSVWLYEAVRSSAQLGYIGEGSSVGGTTKWMPDVYSSTYDPSRVYQARESGVYAIDGYGQGDETALFTVASGQYVHHMTVIPSVDLDQDVICVLIYTNLAGTGATVYYSTDSGSSWIQGPILNVDTAHGLGQAWFVSSTSSLIVST